MKLIGIGADGKAGLPQQYVQWIEQCDVLVGGKRQLREFADYGKETVVLEGGLRTVVERLQAETRPTVVLASGDPMFYGIGAYLAKKLPLEVYPSLSSIQIAFAKANLAWHDAYLTSVHGRSMRGLIQRIDGRKKVALLTDETNSPREIARYLLKYGVHEYRVFVGESLGAAHERTGWYSLEEAADEIFAPLNVMILEQTVPYRRTRGNIADHHYYQRKPESGLITKREVRQLTVSALELEEDSVVWDIGTCTASIAIEAGKAAREGSVYAIERHADDLELGRLNALKFRVDCTFVHNKAPNGMEEFPNPDAVFIGGTGGSLEDIIAYCCERLNENGRIVLNAATLENMMDAKKAFEQQGFETDITLIQLSKSKPIAKLTRLKPLNPVFMVTAWKETN